MKVYKFMAPWCQPCKTLTQKLKLKGFTLPEYNIDNPDIAPLMERFNIKSVPTIVIEENDGTYKSIVGVNLTQDTFNILEKYTTR